MTLIFVEYAAYEVGENGHEWSLAETETPVPAAVITTSDAPPRGLLPVVNIEFASCAREGCDPDWWFPSGSDDTDTATLAQSICGGCPERSACRERGKRELTGVWGGVWVDDPHPEGTKVCIKCRRPFPLNEFLGWGDHGRRSKKCGQCDPRASLKNQPQLGVAS